MHAWVCTISASDTGGENLSTMVLRMKIRQTLLASCLLNIHFLFSFANRIPILFGVTRYTSRRQFPSLRWRARFQPMRYKQKCCAKCPSRLLKGSWLHWNVCSFWPSFLPLDESHLDGWSTSSHLRTCGDFEDGSHRPVWWIRMRKGLCARYLGSHNTSPRCLIFQLFLWKKKSQTITTKPSILFKPLFMEWSCLLHVVH